AAVPAAQAAREADVLIVAVKPQDIEPLIAEIAPTITPGTLLVSVGAGWPTSLYEDLLPARTHGVRVMPNTPLWRDEAKRARERGQHATNEHMDTVTTLLQSVGKVLRVPESQLNAVTALSGSGPAYFFFLVEAMIDAGIMLGLP